MVLVGLKFLPVQLLSQQRIVGCPISRSFFARCGRPRTSIGSSWRVEECRSAAVVSHISQKTSEIWGTLRFVVGKEIGPASYALAHPLERTALSLDSHPAPPG